MAAMSPDEIFLEKVLAALERTQLEALIVGTAAAVMQGASLMTRDIDILVRDTDLNRRKLEQLSSELGAARPVPVSELSNTVTIAGADIPIDVLFGSMAGGLTFEGVRSRAVRISVGRHEALVAALADIISSKEAAGRPKDL